MITRCIKKEFKNHKIIMFTLTMFILLATLLISSALIVITNLNGSLNHLFSKAKVPSYVQMYAGDLSQKDVDQFSQDNELIQAQQTVTMLGISGENLFLQKNGNSEVNSIIENSFVVQNKDFDFLLDNENNIAQVADGEIGMPIYHQQKYHLNLGDQVMVKINDYQKNYRITTFIRDAQMNPALVTSKRFLVSQNDWQNLANKISKREYLIEFALKNEDKISSFEKQYEQSNLPQSGTALNRSLYQVLNALTDGLIVVIITLISLLLLMIAALCLRFTILTALEEDYREIGIMKVIGINDQNIRKIYLTKYLVFAAIACIVGYLISLPLANLFTQSISTYMGTGAKTFSVYLVSLVGALCVFLFVYAFCRLIFRRFKKISAYEALQVGEISGNRKTAGKLQLNAKKRLIHNQTIFIGVREVLIQLKSYILLILIVAVCLFLMSVPLHFLQTIQSPSFISYMGAGKSDLRIDVHQAKEYPKEFEQLKVALKEDPDITKQVSYTTSAYQVKNADNKHVTIKIENTDDFQTFPLSYVSGKAPQNNKEIALSSMNAEEFDVTVGDKLTILLANKATLLTVSGIYQDVTNGGKTSKAMLASENSNILWHTINFDVKDKLKIKQIKKKLEQQFKHIKVTDTNEYIQQTLGGVFKQVTMISIVALVLGLLIASLVTTMFFKMILAKEAKNIAIMKTIGISNKTIGQQYLVRGIFSLGIGLIIGQFATNLLGSKVASVLLSGVSTLTFVANPVLYYLLIPASLLVVVCLSIYFINLSIKKINIMLVAK